MFSKNLTPIVGIFVIFALFACKSDPNKEVLTTTSTKAHVLLIEQPDSIRTPKGMVWVPGKTFLQGAKPNDTMAMRREMPSHMVRVDGFFMDVTEVTNAQFKAFVDATGYVTVAERPIDWELMKKELPEGTPKPPDSVLQPGSLIFNKQVRQVATMDNYIQWWTWKVGANWKHPAGPNSTIKGKDDYPVVHIAYEDALAYCKWANRRLPTEAEWESAAQGSLDNAIYTWGNNPDSLQDHANTWQGVFPVENLSTDGFEFIAPVASFPPNSIGLYDMLGNVWEMTQDVFDMGYYKTVETPTPSINPTGAANTYSSSHPYPPQRVMKGGSFLCHVSYCASFRISARMGMSPDSGSDHTGFRTVATVEMLTSVPEE